MRPIQMVFASSLGRPSVHCIFPGGEAINSIWKLRRIVWKSILFLALCNNGNMKISWNNFIHFGYEDWGTMQKIYNQGIWMFCKVHEVHVCGCEEYENTKSMFENSYTLIKASFFKDCILCHISHIFKSFRVSFFCV